MTRREMFVKLLENIDKMEIDNKEEMKEKLINEIEKIDKQKRQARKAREFWGRWGGGCARV